jgi:hypothetical protein
MKHLYKIIFLFVLINFNSSSVYSSNKIEENIILKSVADPSGQITGNNKSINVPVPKNVAGPFPYFLTAVTDKEGIDIDVSNFDIVTIKVNPLVVVDFTYTNNYITLLLLYI